MLITIGVLSLGPIFVSNLSVNLAMIGLRNGLVKARSQANGHLVAAYPFNRVLSENETEPLRATFQQAIELDSTNLVAHWGLIRAALASGDVSLASRIAERVLDRARHNELMFLDAVYALAESGQSDRAIELYETTPRLSPAVYISNTMALAYLQRGGPESLDNALALRPDDLFANYHLWKQSRQLPDPSKAESHAAALTHFSLDAIAPPNEHLFNYAMSVMPELFTDGLWDRTTLVNVTAYLVWQRYGSPAVERLLQTLSARYPDEPDWAFYLGEVYHRRGDWSAAEEAYRHVLAIDPEYAQALMRLGMVADARAEAEPAESKTHWEQAAQWYEQYHEAAPDDVLGVEKLAEALEALDRPEASSLRAELEARTDDRRIAAKLLELPIEDVELGPSLVENGDFEAWQDGSPAGWRLGLYLGRDGAGGLYVASEDDLIPGWNLARILSLWGGLLPDGTTTYAEYFGNGFETVDSKYLISLSYATRHFAEGNGLVFLGDYSRVGGPVLAHDSLPDSSGEWRQFRTVVDGVTAPVNVVPLVRIWGVGQMWIRALEIRPVIYAKGLDR